MSAVKKWLSARPAGGSLWNFSGPLEVGPWVISKWQFSGKSGVPVCSDVEFFLEHEILCTRLKQRLIEAFGPSSEHEIGFNHSDQLMIACHVPRPRSKELNNQAVDEAIRVQQTEGAFGLVIDLRTYSDQLSFGLSDYWGIGYLPSGWVETILSQLVHVLALPKDYHRSLHEIRWPVSGVLSHLLNSVLDSQKSPSIDWEAFNVALDGFLKCKSREANVRYSLSRNPPNQKLARTILEERELGPKIAKLDEQIISGKRHHFLPTLLEIDEENLVLQRRIAMTYLEGFHQRKVAKVDRLLRSEWANMAFISYCLGSTEGLPPVKIVSKLGKRLEKLWGSLDHHPIVARLILELLGDSWSIQDPTKAMQCYEKVLFHHPNHKRLLTKAVIVSRDHKPHLTLELLAKLREIETRKGKKVAILELAGELGQKVGVSGSRDTACEEILDIDPLNFKALEDLSVSYVASQKWDDLLAIWERAAAGAARRSSKETKNQIDLTLARIWFDRFHDKGMAAKHLSHIIERHQKGGKLIDGLMDLVKQLGDEPLLDRAQRLNLESAIKGGKKSDITDQVSTLYRMMEEGDPEFCDYYLEAFHAIGVKPIFLDEILGRDDPNFPWKTLYNRLKAHQEQASPDELVNIQRYLAEISRSRLNEPAQAARRYHELLRQGQLDAQDRQFLFDFYRERGRIEDLVAAMSDHMKQAPHDADTLKELLNHAEHISPDELDDMVIKLLHLDQEREFFVKVRVLYYRGQKDLTQIRKLWDRLTRLSGDPIFIQNWASYMLEAVESFEDEARYPFIATLFDSMRTKYVDAAIWSKDALHALARCPDVKYLKPHIIRLLKQGIIPKLKDKQITLALEGESEWLGDYYYLLAEKNKDISAAERAVKEYRKAPDTGLKRFKSIGQLGTKQKLSRDYLTEFLNFKGEKKSQELFSRVITRQNQLGNDAPELTFALVREGGLAGDELTKKLLYCLADPSYWSYPEEVSKMIARLAGDPAIKPQALPIVETHLERLLQEGRETDALYVAYECLKLDLTSYDVLWMIFSCEAKDPHTKLDTLVQSWSQVAAHVSRRPEAEQLVAETLECISPNRVDDVMREIAATVQRDGAESDFSDAIRSELEAFELVRWPGQGKNYGTRLADYHRLRPEDQRVWLHLLELWPEQLPEKDRDAFLARVEAANSMHPDPELAGWLEKRRLDESKKVTYRKSLKDFETEWRQLEADEVPSETDFHDLISTPFNDPVAKHLAVQVYAIRTGLFSVLKDYEKKVWVDFSLADYSLDGGARWPKKGRPQSLGSPLAKMVEQLGPMLVSYFEEKFSLSQLSRAIGNQDPSQIIDSRRPVLWNEGILNKVGMGAFREHLQNKRFVAFSIEGLASRLYYDGRHRAVYFDASYYLNQPNSHLFHRMRGLIWSVLLGYYVPSQLHPSKAVWPLLEQVFAKVGEFSSMNRLKIRMGLEKDKINYLLDRVDKESFINLMTLAGTIGEEDLLRFYHDFKQYIYRVLLTESLDLVGLCERISNDDLLSTDSPERFLEKSFPHIHELVKFAMSIKEN